MIRCDGSHIKQGVKQSAGKKGANGAFLFAGQHIAKWSQSSRQITEVAQRLAIVFADRVGSAPDCPI